MDQKVLSREEISSRYHINVERYVKTLEIELGTLSELVTSHVVPAIEKQITALNAAHEGLTSAGLKKLHLERMKSVETVFEGVLNGLADLSEVMEKIHSSHDETSKMKMLATQARPVAEKLREAADKAEQLVADELGPFQSIARCSSPILCRKGV